MARDEDKKLDISRNRLEDHTQKVENRFDKQARAKRGQDGEVDDRKMDKSHRSTGKGNPNYT
jgi:hypothetical protein